MRAAIANMACLFVVACGPMGGGRGGGEQCEAQGATEACTCSDGKEGFRHCERTLWFGVCDCSPPAPPSSPPAPGEAVECGADFAAGAGSSYAQGETMVDLELKNCDGEVIKMSEYLCDKKAVLMDFAAGWCQPCRDHQPELAKWHEKYADEGLGLLVILRENGGPADPATSTFCEEWKNEYSLPFDVLIDPTDKFTGNFLGGGGATFPMEVLVDHDWKIIVKSFGSSGDTEPVIQDVLGL